MGQIKNIKLHIVTDIKFNLQMQNYSPKCSACGQVISLNDVIECKQCSRVVYCCVQHQTAHWPMHRLQCFRTPPHSPPVSLYNTGNPSSPQSPSQPLYAATTSPQLSPQPTFNMVSSPQPRLSPQSPYMVNQYHGGYNNDPISNIYQQQQQLQHQLQQNQKHSPQQLQALQQQ